MLGAPVEDVMRWHQVFVDAGRRALTDLVPADGGNIDEPSSILATRRTASVVGISPVPCGTAEVVTEAVALARANDDATDAFDGVLAHTVGRFDQLLDSQNDLEGISLALLHGEPRVVIEKGLAELRVQLLADVSPEEKKQVSRTLTRSNKQLLKRVSRATKLSHPACKSYLSSNQDQSMKAAMGRASARVSHSNSILGAVIGVVSEEASVFRRRIEGEGVLEEVLESLRSEIHTGAVVIYEELAPIMGWPSKGEVEELYVTHEQALERASKAFDSGSFADAIKDGVTAVEARPREPWARLIVAHSLLSTGDLEAASKALESIDVREGAGDLQMYSCLGTAELALKRGDPRAALEELGRWERVGGTDSDPRLRDVRASALAALGELPKAVRELELLVIEDPSALERIVSSQNWSESLSAKEMADLKRASVERVDRILIGLSAKDGGQLFQEFKRWPRQKKSGALKSNVGLGKDEYAVIAHDSTVFGGAKEGVTFTNKAIYWKELLSSSGAFDYDAITQLSCDDGCLEVNGRIVIDGDEELADFVFEALAQVCGWS